MKKAYLALIFFCIILLSITIGLKLSGLAIFTSTEICQDSDLGDEPLIAGTIIGTNYKISNLLQPEHFSKKDYCENENYLVEYYCIKIDEINTESVKKKYECSTRCIDGTCQDGIKKEVKFISIKSLVLILIVFSLILWLIMRNTKKSKTLSKKHN